MEYSAFQSNSLAPYAYELPINNLKMITFNLSL